MVSFINLCQTKRESVCYAWLRFDPYDPYRNSHLFCCRSIALHLHALAVMETKENIRVICAKFIKKHIPLNKFGKAVEDLCNILALIMIA